jgi:hypothetical protein
MKIMGHCGRHLGRSGVRGVNRGGRDRHRCRRDQIIVMTFIISLIMHQGTLGDMSFLGNAGIEMGEEIGRGGFGRVYKCKVHHFGAEPKEMVSGARVRSNEIIGRQS